MLSPDALASEESTYPIAPVVDLTICATPPLPLPPRLLEGQLMVELGPSFHTLGTASCRNKEKFAVVPEESERRAIVIAVLGSLTPGLIFAIAGSFHFVIFAWKMSAMTVGVSFRLLTPDRLYAIVIGPMITGKYSTVGLPAKLEASSDGIGESEPAYW